MYIDVFIKTQYIMSIKIVKVNIKEIMTYLQ